MTSTSPIESFWPEVASAVRRRMGERPPDEYEPWLGAVFPNTVGARPMLGEHHHEYWRWVWSIRRHTRPRPFVACWARDGGKTTSFEMGAVHLAGEGKRRYHLVVCRTQSQANDRISNLEARLTSPRVARFYPGLASTGVRVISTGPRATAWRRNRLETLDGTVFDGAGLQESIRGRKVKDYRPDMLWLDDLDGRNDSDVVTTRLRDELLNSVIPVGTPNTGVCFLQNLVTDTGLMWELAGWRDEGGGSATWLGDRIVCGPVPAVEGLEWRQEVERDEEGGAARSKMVILAGTPTWPYFTLKQCEQWATTMGPEAFIRECQHQVSGKVGALWTRKEIEACRINPGDEPPMVRVVVGVDPTGGAAEAGIVVVGLGEDGLVYVLADESSEPVNWGRAVVDAFDGWAADLVKSEPNFGGDMVPTTIRAASPGRMLPIDNTARAARGKLIRAEPVRALYGRAKDGTVEGSRIRHVGRFERLEKEMVSYTGPPAKSPNRLDALVIATTEVALAGRPDPYLSLG